MVTLWPVDVMTGQPTTDILLTGFQKGDETWVRMAELHW
jgi:hypothetical protein